jgi:hypothetical protein
MLLHDIKISEDAGHNDSKIDTEDDHLQFIRNQIFPKTPTSRTFHVEEQLQRIFSAEGINLNLTDL